MIFLFLIGISHAYKLLNNLTCVLPKLFQPCEDLAVTILMISNQVFGDLQDIGLPIGLGISDNYICSQDNTHYGQMLYNPTSSTSTTDLLFRNSIRHAHNTAYNVILHEALHSLGLDHNDGEPGIMNYAVSENWWGGLVNDERKLWISVDDLRGVHQNCFQS